MTWIYGNKRAGYKLVKLKRKREPYRIQIWNGGEIVRQDDFDSKEEAVKWARQRKKYYYK